MPKTHNDPTRLRDPIADAFDAAVRDLPRPNGEILMEMVRAATTTPPQGTPNPSRRIAARRPALAVGAVLALAFAAPLLAGVNPLDTIAQLTGIRERRPLPASAGYKPADVPYVSVQPLMRRIGSTKPIVPLTAVASRGGLNVVFVVSRPDYTSRYANLNIYARPVTVGARLGNAVAVTAGLTACDRVVISPPESLRDGDHVRSYAEDVADTGPSIDYNVLFAGLPKAPMSPIEGGIAWQDGSQVVIGITYSGATPPAGSHYIFRAPNGTVQDIPYARNVEARVPETVLEQGEPVGSATLVNQNGTAIARAALDWYCTS